jgi:ATP-dependent DNA ligase
MAVRAQARRLPSDCVQGQRNRSPESRNDNDFNVRYPAVVKALAKMPENTVIDGEVVAFDQEGRPSFNALQNYGSAPAPVVYYVFDVMVLAGENVMCEPLETRERRPG